MLDVPFDEDIFRQRERTVDNIKRIYAVVYSLSFTSVLKEMYDFASTYILTRSSDMTPAIHDTFVQGMTLRLAMVVVFISTVAVFSYQADKFLDLRYTLPPRKTGDDDPARHPMRAVTRHNFATDALSLIFTLVPFIFMAYAFNAKLMEEYGIIPFFVSYQLLLGLAIFFLVIVTFPQLRQTANTNPVGELSENERYATLSVNWFWTNGLAVAVLTAAYLYARARGGLCTKSPIDNQMSFAFAFIVVALLRNGYDFYSAWPFLYVNKRGVLAQEITPLMRRYATFGPRGKLAALVISGTLGLISAIWALARTLPDINPYTC